MSAKLPTYPNYKASGVNWLQNVPEHWEIKPLKYVASLKGRLGWQGLRSDEYTDDGPFLVTSEHFSNDKIEWHRCYHVSPDRYDLAPEIQLKGGDLLMMKDGAAMGKLAFVDELPGPACLNSHLLLFRPQNGRFENRFLYYVLGGPGFNSYMMQRRTGTTFFGISQESIGSFSFAVPPCSEQASILEFLRDEASKIDELVAEQRRLIELLREKRQAVISYAITRGFDHDSSMKESGIDWLGEMPGHWRLKRIKYVLRKLEQGWSPQCENVPAEEGEWGVLKVGCVNGGNFNPDENKALPAELSPIPALGIRSGDLLISRANTRELVGSAAVSKSGYPRLLLCDKLFRLDLRAEMCLQEYLAMFLSTAPARGEIELSATGASSSMVNIGQSTITEMPMPLPSLGEQKRIVDFIANETIIIDELVAAASHAIELLEERRTSLISAAVTGQIDVRNCRSQEASAVCQ